MRVVFNGWFIDQPHTGSGQYVRQLLKQLPRVAPQHDYALIVPHRNSFEIVDLDAQTELQSLASTVNRPSSNYRKVLFEQDVTPRAARAYRADVLHVPYWAPPLRSHVPIVVTIHDIIPLVLKAYRGGPLGSAYTGLVSAAARGATLILTDSDASRADIVARLSVPLDRVRTIYLATDDKFTDRVDPIDYAALRKNHDLPEDYVLYLGGFDARKNIEAALQTYTWAQNILGEDYPLVIAGALPDRHDAFPEIVGDAGMLVDPHDARAMAGALIAVCTEDSLHDDLSERALKQAAKFSWEKCARETVAVYESVMSNE
jgi:glycosyltransferase involved in cell wall biosynthesis